MRIPLDKAIFVLKMLLEGTSINATVRLTGVAKATILELLVLIGDRAQQFWADRMKGIQCEEVQVDEVWGFVGMKEKTRVHHHAPEVFGDAYCFTAIDRKTKLLVAFHIGKRTFDDAQWFFNLLADAIDGDLQLTTDGFMPYCTTIVEAFRHRVNFAQLIKIFGPAKNPGAGTYTPSEIKRTRTRVIVGKPDKAAISTSIVERSNRTWRMRCRRMTRLTDAHSKKWENHTAALALTFVAYNFVTVHTTLKTTPAVAHGLTDHPWTMEELLTELATHS
jgi:IS1 family transposase